MAFLEVIGAGLMRFAALCFQWNWFSTIESYYAKNKKREWEHNKTWHTRIVFLLSSSESKD
jgi:hypothetical protein